MSARFRVKRASEMLQDEPYRAVGTEGFCHERIAREFGGPGWPGFVWPEHMGFAWATHMAVDTLDEWHTARVEAPKDGCWNCDNGAPPTPGVLCEKCAQVPTDEEIVQGYEEWLKDADASQRQRPRFITETVLCLCAARGPDGYERVTIAEARAAWSRALRKRTDASKERERQRIVCEGTLAEDY